MLPHVPAPGNAGPPPIRPDIPAPEVIDLLKLSRQAAAQHPAYLAAQRIQNTLNEAADACRLLVECWTATAIREDLARRGLLGLGLIADDFYHTHGHIGRMAWLLDFLADGICLEVCLPMADGTVPFPSDTVPGRRTVGQPVAPAAAAPASVPHGWTAAAYAAVAGSPANRSAARVLGLAVDLAAAANHHLDEYPADALEDAGPGLDYLAHARRHIAGLAYTVGETADALGDVVPEPPAESAAEPTPDAPTGRRAS